MLLLVEIYVNKKAWRELLYFPLFLFFSLSFSYGYALRFALTWRTQAKENCKMWWATFRSFIFLRCSAAMRLANYLAIRTIGYPTICPHLSLLLFSDSRFYLSFLFLFFTQVREYIYARSFFPRISSFVSSWYKFIPLTFPPLLLFLSPPSHLSSFSVNDCSG